MLGVACFTKRNFTTSLCYDRAPLRKDCDEKCGFYPDCWWVLLLFLESHVASSDASFIALLLQCVEACVFLLGHGGAMRRGCAWQGSQPVTSISPRGLLRRYVCYQATKPGGGTPSVPRRPPRPTEFCKGRKAEGERKALKARA